MLKICNSCLYRNKPFEEPCKWCDSNDGTWYKKDPNVHMVIKPFFGDYGIDSEDK